MSAIGLADSPYLTLEEGARFYRFDDCANPRDAFRRFLDRHAIPVKRLGKKVLVDKRLVDAVLDEVVPQQRVRLHARQVNRSARGKEVATCD